MSCSTDIHLIRRAQNGDQSAFDVLYRTYAPKIHNLIVSRTGTDEADDLVQITFIRAFQKIHSFRGEAAFMTWLTRIAINVCYSHWQARKTRAARFDTTENPEYIPDASQMPESQLHLKEYRILVQKGIRTLPEQHQKAMWLRYVQDRSYEEITRVLEVPIGTVKTWLARGRKQLREELQRLGIYGYEPA